MYIHYYIVTIITLYVVDGKTLKLTLNPPEESDAGLYTCHLSRDSTNKDSVLLTVIGKLIHISVHALCSFFVLQLIHFSYMAVHHYLKTKQHYVIITYFLTAQFTLPAKIQYGNLDQTEFHWMQVLQINMQ